MAKPYKVKKRGKKYYWIIGTLNGYRFDRSLKTTVKALAEETATKFYNEVYKRQSEQRLGIKYNKKIKLFDLLALYDDYCLANNRPSTYSIKKFVVKPIRAFFGNVQIDAITAERIEAYKYARLLEVKPATVNRELSALKHTLKLAVDWGYLIKSPAAKVKQLKEPPGRERCLTEDEEERLLNTCSSELRPIVVLALHTGMRRGEILNLEWRDVDLEAKEILIRHSKNGYSRVAYVNEVLYNTLVVIERAGEKVFFSRLGCPYSSLRTGFVAALQRAGIEDFRFHDLRHTFVSRLVAKGVDVFLVADLAGHRSLEMTRRYSHTNRERCVEAVNLLTQ